MRSGCGLESVMLNTVRGAPPRIFKWSRTSDVTTILRKSCANLARTVEERYPHEPVHSCASRRTWWFRSRWSGLCVI